VPDETLMLRKETYQANQDLRDRPVEAPELETTNQPHPTSDPGALISDGLQSPAQIQPNLTEV